MHKDKSYLQMQRELLDIGKVELEKDNKGDYIATVDTVLPSVYEADTMEHAIDKAWTALCYQS